MTRSEHLKHLIAWADKWLAVPESELPGKLTHNKCRETQQDAIARLIDHAIDNGRWAVNGKVFFDNDQ